MDKQKFDFENGLDELTRNLFNANQKGVEQARKSMEIPKNNKKSENNLLNTIRKLSGRK